MSISKNITVKICTCIAISHHCLRRSSSDNESSLKTGSIACVYSTQNDWKLQRSS